jgi:hypothetical protein
MRRFNLAAAIKRQTDTPDFDAVGCCNLALVLETPGCSA